MTPMGKLMPAMFECTSTSKVHGRRWDPTSMVRPQTTTAAALASPAMAPVSPLGHLEMIPMESPMPATSECMSTSKEPGRRWDPTSMARPQATMLSEPTPGGGMLVFHANPGHGTDSESKSPPNGRASGTVRRSVDGGLTWEASVRLNGAHAYSYSCLSHVPQPGFIGLAYETVLPGSDISAKASANNVVFTLVPQNFSAAQSEPVWKHSAWLVEE